MANQIENQLQELMKSFKWKRTDKEIYWNTVLLRKNFDKKDALKVYILAFIQIIVFVVGLLALISRIGSFTLYLLTPVIFTVWAGMGYMQYLFYEDIVESYKEKRVLQYHNQC